MLAQCGQDCVDLCRDACLSEVVELSWFGPKWLSNDHGAFVLGVEHFSIFISSQESDVEGVLKNCLLVVFEGAPDDMHVGIEEVLLEVSACAEVNQIHDVSALVIQIVGRVWIRLHQLELEQLLEAERNEQRTDSIPQLLRCIKEGINLNAVDELRAKYTPRRQVVDDPWTVEILWVGNKMLPICSLIGGFTFIVAFPVQLSSRYIDCFIEVESSWEDAEHVREVLEIVQVAVDAACDTRILIFRATRVPYVRRTSCT